MRIYLARNMINGKVYVGKWEKSNIQERRTQHKNRARDFAEGTFTFEEMVDMAKSRFSHRWSKMKFQVVPAKESVAA